MLGWDWCGFHKKCVRTRDAELAFLHPMGSAGHVVHSSASGPRKVNTLFFMLGWARYGFNKKHLGTRVTELVFFHPLGSMGHVVDSSVSRA
jgi:hypothetical protein